MSTEPTIPFDLANERAVLGACLIDRDAITAVREILSLEDFYLEKHALIYGALLHLVDQRVPPDLVTVSGRLREAGHLAEIGGMAYLGELAGEVPTSVHAEHYARRVVETASRRRIIAMAAEIQIWAHEGGDVEALFSEVQTMVETTRIASSPRANWAEAVIPARMLYRYKFEQIPFTVADILPPGTMLLTGKPKTRKSWLALNIAWAVAAGGKALGKYDAQQGDVLYIDLEMGAARLHKRLHVVSPQADPPKGFQFATKWPPVGEGFESWLRDYLKSHPFTRLVVVDTLVGVRVPRRRYEEPYESDKRFTQSLTSLCQDYRISMLLIHHSRKSDGSDVTDDASGSTGLTGGVDNTAILRLSRTERNAGELYLRGRDIVIEGDLKLKWDGRLAQWNHAGDIGDRSITPERLAVMRALRDQPGLRPKELALVLNRPEPGTRRLLSEMAQNGLIVSDHGAYFLPEDGGDLESEDD